MTVSLENRIKMTDSVENRINLRQEINNLRFVIVMYLLEVKLNHAESGHYKKSYEQIRLKNPDFNLPIADLINLNNQNKIKPFFEVPRQLWSKNEKELNKELLDGQYLSDRHRFMDYYEGDYDEFEGHRAETAGLDYPFKRAED